MTQLSVLAPGNTAAPSTDIVVASGAVVTVGIYAASDSGILPASVSLRVVLDTPGADNFVDRLDNRNRQTQLSGPGTFRVLRPAYTGDPFGVFTEGV